MKIWQKLVLVLGGSSLLLGTVSILTIKIDAEIQSQTEEVLFKKIKLQAMCSARFNLFKI